MKAVIVRAYGDVRELRYEESDLPALGASPDDARVTSNRRGRAIQESRRRTAQVSSRRKQAEPLTRSEHVTDIGR